MERTKPTTACLVVQYSGAEKVPWKPAREAVMRMTPVFFFLRRARMAIRDSFNG